MDTIATCHHLETEGNPIPRTKQTTQAGARSAANARAQTAGATHARRPPRTCATKDHPRPWHRLQHSHAGHMARKRRSRSAETRDPTTPHLSREAQGKRIATCLCQRTTSLGPWQALASVPRCCDASRGPNAHGARTPRAANAKPRHKTGPTDRWCPGATPRTECPQRAPPHESYTPQARRRHGHGGRTDGHTCHARRCLPA